ncbi:hypothetical protein GCM10027089_45380 [Nocardia thraciensis]
MAEMVWVWQEMVWVCREERVSVVVESEREGTGTVDDWDVGGDEEAECRDERGGVRPGAQSVQWDSASFAPRARRWSVAPPRANSLCLAAVK